MPGHAATMLPGMIGHEMDDDHLRRAANPTGRPRPGEDVEMIKVGQREMLPATIKAQAFRGSDWFFWIAALSTLNSVLTWFGTGRMMLMGLGTPLLVHGFGSGLAQRFGSTTVIPVLTITLEVLIIAFFVVCGFLARRSWLGAIYAGVAVYLLDAALLAYFSIWLSVAFHGLVLYFILRTLPLHRALAKAQREKMAADAVGFVKVVS
jgi:hypothetical protein